MRAHFWVRTLQPRHIFCFVNMNVADCKHARKMRVARAFGNELEQTSAPLRESEADDAPCCVAVCVVGQARRHEPTRSVGFLFTDSAFTAVILPRTGGRARLPRRHRATLLGPAGDSVSPEPRVAPYANEVIKKTYSMPADRGCLSVIRSRDLGLAAGQTRSRWPDRPLLRSRFRPHRCPPQRHQRLTDVS